MAAANLSPQPKAADIPVGPGPIQTPALHLQADPLFEGGRDLALSQDQAHAGSFGERRQQGRRSSARGEARPILSYQKAQRHSRPSQRPGGGPSLFRAPGPDHPEVVQVAPVGPDITGIYAPGEVNQGDRCRPGYLRRQGQAEIECTR